MHNIQARATSREEATTHEHRPTRRTMHLYSIVTYARRRRDSLSIAEDNGLEENAKKESASTMSIGKRKETEQKPVAAASQIMFD